MCIIDLLVRGRGALGGRLLENSAKTNTNIRTGDYGLPRAAGVGLYGEHGPLTTVRLVLRNSGKG